MAPTEQPERWADMDNDDTDTGYRPPKMVEKRAADSADKPNPKRARSAEQLEAASSDTAAASASDAAALEEKRPGQKIAEKHVGALKKMAMDLEKQNYQDDKDKVAKVEAPKKDPTSPKAKAKDPTSPKAKAKDPTSPRATEKAKANSSSAPPAEDVPNADDMEWEKRKKKRKDTVDFMKKSDPYQESLKKRKTDAGTPAAKTPDPEDRAMSKRDWEKAVQEWKHAL